MNLIITRAMHAPLHERFDLSSGRFVKVGSEDGIYAPIDRATGAEYRCLGTPAKRMKVSHSSDWRPGMFYPKNTFIYAYDENKHNESLSHERLEEICIQIRWVNIKRVILPKGYTGGRMTWYNAVYFTPVENQPPWEFWPEILKRLGDIQVNKQEDSIEVYIEEKV